LRTELDDLADIMQTLAGRMLSLASLSLSPFGPKPQIDHGVDMNAFPALTAVDLTVIHMPHRLKLPWSQLRELAFHNLSVADGSPAFLKTLRKCTSLRKIVFDDVRLDDSSDDEAPAAATAGFSDDEPSDTANDDDSDDDVPATTARDGLLFESKSVRECVIRWNGMLNKLALPLLETLELTPFDHLAFTAFLHRSRPPLQRLYIQAPQRLNESEWKNSIHLLDSLVELTVDATRVDRNGTYVSYLLRRLMPEPPTSLAPRLSASSSSSSLPLSLFSLHSGSGGDRGRRTPLPALAHLKIHITLGNPNLPHSADLAFQAILGDVILPFLASRVGVRPHPSSADASAPQRTKLRSFSIVDNMEPNIYGAPLAMILKRTAKCRTPLEEIKKLKSDGTDIHLFHREWTVSVPLTRSRL
jgi:hypothetical protein